MNERILERLKGCFISYPIVEIPLISDGVVGHSLAREVERSTNWCCSSGRVLKH